VITLNEDLSMRQPLRQKNRLVFVLWGAAFDEAVATRFVSELRDAGIGVKIVGLAGRFALGRRRVAIGIDLTLEEALALSCEVDCLILPCEARVLQEAENDPRLVRLYQQVQRGGGFFVARDLAVFSGSHLREVAAPADFCLYGGRSLSLCVDEVVMGLS
jgi:hypothetical protein